MIGNPLLLSDEGYQISRSVRLRSSASAYFNRTPGSASNRKTWTWSGWIKRGNLGSSVSLFAASTSANSYGCIYFDSGNCLNFQDRASGVNTALLTTTQVFRDPSAWYHIVVQFDTTQVTSSNRIRMYVNGSQITDFSTASYPTQNLDGFINNNILHEVGSLIAGLFFDGYMTEVNFVDGQALTPASFGETDALTGVWKPKKYTGTYGTNGFYLNFSDNSSNTATTIGKDYSGNGNNWTPNNISVTSGATYDSMLDVPTLWADGGNGRGNYATLNPLANPSTLSAANLTTTGGDKWSISTIGMTSGKWYAEATVTTVGAESSVGIANASYSGSNAYVGGTATSWGYAMNGNKYTSSSGSAYGATYTSGDVVGIAFDADNGTLEFFKNGTTQGIAYSSLTSGPYFFAVEGRTSTSANNISINFGQRPFAYTPPSGFKALNTGNLPEPVIKKGNAWFDVAIWTGNGATSFTSPTIGFQPDFVWAKKRSGATNHQLYDSVRGVGNNKELESNTTSAEGASNAEIYGYLSAFNSNGFSAAGGTDGSFPIDYFNGSGSTYVAWQWKEGATQGFDIVTYTGDSAASRSISHSLGVAPKMIIAKIRSTANGWPVWHTSLGATGYLILNQTQAASTNSAIWNSAPTSTTFAVGNNGLVNASGETYVAYLFAEVAGFSRFGSYTGNGSSDGPFVFLGFRPRYVMWKRTDTTGDWVIQDTARGPYNQTPNYLIANTSGAEGAPPLLDINSNGFKVRINDVGTNANGGTYIYAAFAEFPFRTALAR